MKKLIIYQSKTGFTKRYAEWIQEAVKGDLTSVTNVTKDMLRKYDIIIFGSYIRMERICGLAKIWNLVKDNPNQHCIFFATGATSPKKKKWIEKIWEKSIAKEVLKKVPHFYLQSGIRYEKLDLAEKFLIKIFACIMNVTKKKSKFEISFDLSSKQNIEPLVKCVKGLEASKGI